MRSTVAVICMHLVVSGIMRLVVVSRLKGRRHKAYWWHMPPVIHYRFIRPRPGVPSQLAAVIDQCLRKPPGERFATGEALADALAKALDAVEHQERTEGTGAILTNDEAMLVWRRAAELQAEAAARLEARMRVETEAHQRVPGVKRVSDGRILSAPAMAISDAPVTDHDSAAGNPAAPPPLPTDAYRLRDVEAAAAEVGISQQYVALALAELHKSPQALQREQAPATFFERFSTSLFRSSQRILSVSRVYHNSPRIILQALGRTLQSAPFSLTLGDTLGGHPLDGGVLVFDIPKQNLGESNYKWMWTRNGLYAKVVRVTLASVPGDSRKTEVTLQVDMRNGLVANLAGMAAGSGVVGGVGALAGLIVAKKALLLAGAAVLGPVGVGAALGGMGALTFAAPLYRWQVRKSTTELNAALAAIETSMRTIDIFGESSASMPRITPQKLPFT